MKRNNTTNDIDRRIAAQLRNSLPQAPENEWFTRRVMNRLPEKRHNRLAVLVQWICYLLSLAALGIGAWLTIDNILIHGLSTSSLVFLAIIPLLAIFCTGMMAAPAVRKVIDGEQNIFK